MAHAWARPKRKQTSKLSRTCSERSFRDAKHTQGRRRNYPLLRIHHRSTKPNTGLSMPHAGDNTWKPRYGMDSGGDGVDAKELAAYYEVKKEAEANLAKEQATMMEARAKTMAKNASDFATVPNFEARRGTHMRTLNTDQWGREPTYGARYDQRPAGYPGIQEGPFAKMMARKQTNTQVSPDKPANWLGQTPSYCHTPPPGWRKKSGFYNTGQGFYNPDPRAPKGSGMREVEL